MSYKERDRHFSIAHCVRCTNQVRHIGGKARIAELTRAAAKPGEVEAQDAYTGQSQRP
jgi:hypothetical protein